MKLKIFFSAIVIILGLLISLHSIYKINDSRKIFENIELTSILAEKIIYYDEVLTMSARMAAFNTGSNWITRYNKNINPLDEAIKKASELVPEVEVELNKVSAINQQLIELEEKSLEFSQQQKFIKAQELLFSNKYEVLKAQYQKGLNNSIDIISDINNKLKIETTEHLRIMKFNIIISIIIITIGIAFIYTVLSHAIKTEQYKKLIDFSSDGIHIIDIHGNIIECSKSFANTLGYTQNEAFKLNVKDWDEGREKKNVLSLILELINSSTSNIFETQHKKKDGTIIDVQINARGIRYKGQNCLFASQRDITEIKKKDFMLFEQSRLASMGEMIGNIAHQWRQPLSVISTGATGMKVQKEYGVLSDELFHNTCEVINSNAQYLSRTIDDFKNFIKGDRVKKVFSLTDAINSCLNLLDGTIKNNNIQIILNLDNNIKVNGYENELTQCLINIFNNAKDAFIESEIKDRLVFIETSLSDENHLKIKIKDNALGIPKDILVKIFEPYFTTKHKSQGTGLGLSMTFGFIVNGMNGNIEAKNIHYSYNDAKYNGVEFKITLPMS